MAGIVLGNHTNTPANLVGQLTGKPSYSYLDTIEIQPTVQYHLDFATLGMRQLAAFKPYALIGPGIWISTLSTPLVVHGSVPGEKYRHSDADVQPGGVYGLGFELALSELNAPPIQKILNRLSVGGEWRYNGLANGEGFQQYTGFVGDRLLGFPSRDRMRQVSRVTWYPRLDVRKSRVVWAAAAPFLQSKLSQGVVMKRMEVRRAIGAEE